MTHPPLAGHELPEHPLGQYERRPGGRSRKSFVFRSCRGGSTYKNPAGYILEYSPDHPKANKAGAIPQHRLVMECVLGRLLETHEVVHHKDGVRHNNSPDNLQLVTRVQHGLEHKDASRKRCSAPLTEQLVKEALRGNTTSQAAGILGVHHQTLRNRFDHLLVKRRSPKGSFEPDFVEKVKCLASDPHMGTRKACRILGVAAATLRACCRIHNVEWVPAPSGRPSHAQLEADGRYLL